MTARSTAQMLSDLRTRNWTLREIQVNFNWPDIYYAVIDSWPIKPTVRVHSDLHPTPDRAIRQAYALAVAELGAIEPTVSDRIQQAPIDPKQRLTPNDEATIRQLFDEVDHA